MLPVGGIATLLCGSSEKQVVWLMAKLVYLCSRCSVFDHESKLALFALRLAFI